MGQILPCANMNTSTSVTMNPGVLEVACCAVGACMLKAWTRFCTRMLLWVGHVSGVAVKVISDCGWCSAVETGKWVELELVLLKTHAENWTSTWLLGLHKRGVQSEAWAGILGKGELGSETDDLWLNFSKIVRCKWYFFLCKYYDGRVSKQLLLLLPSSTLPV